MTAKPKLCLLDDWRRVLRRAWSIRFSLLAAAFTGGLAAALEATAGLAAALLTADFATGLAAVLAADLAAVGLDLRSGILFLDSKRQNQRPETGRHEAQQGRQARRANIWCAVLAGLGGS